MIRPIIFTAAHVDAILAGRKTQTRRAVKLPRGHARAGHEHDWERSWVDPGGAIWGPGPYLKLAFRWRDGGDGAERIHCPYGYPGDALWVREVWVGNGKPMSAMFMPRAMSRLTIEIVKVRCERLHQMSSADGVAEGANSIDEYRATWDALNVRRGYAWESNPWVWVIEFRKRT